MTMIGRVSSNSLSSARSCLGSGRLWSCGRGTTSTASLLQFSERWPNMSGNRPPSRFYRHNRSGPLEERNDQHFQDVEVGALLVGGLSHICRDWTDQPI